MQLADVKTFDQLLPWLSANLEWPVDEIEIAPETAFDELTYEYEAKELGLKQEDIAHVREIRQLRPLVTNQPWGIFFVNFEDKKIPVGVLKRILGGLTLRKRQSANKVEQKAWTLHDLLFISSYGASGERELSFLHFAEENGGKNKTVLKELGWDRQDTQLKLEYIERTLKSKLVWPDDTDDPEAWRAHWSSAFTTTHGATIRTAKELTKQLAALASGIRKAAGDVLEFENKSGPLTKIFDNFKQTIFHNLTPADFADMYAQTICYGLLAKQIERARSGIDTKTLSADDATLTQGVMQPFLKDLMETFLAVGGRKSKIDFNELGVNEVVELLQAADMTAVLLDFGNRNPHEDPVLHFYEHFLRDYDSIMREQRGVYYTPLPVVRFIVRSVHEILQKEFALPDGLADITTWGEMVAKHSGLTIPDGVEASAPFVQILDPATGTGTFLVEVIDLIEKHLKNKWRKAGKSDKETMVLWNEYVPSHLLPRLNGFELMMAPYAIAHIKLGMKLQETGYRPHPAAPRVRVFLTNTLERPDRDDHQTEMGFILESLASEAKGAALIKKSRSNTVIIGNPPYSRNSFNLAPEHRQHVDRFRSINGLPIVQRGHLELERAIQNDYVKFISFALSQLSNSKLGVSGLITSNSFRAAQLLGGLRYHWLDQVSALSIVDLHGYAQGTGMALVDGADQNVFSILEGVAIHFSRMVFGKTGNVIDAQDIRGSRAKKYEWLLSQGLTLGSSIEPKAPRYLMVEINDRSAAEYENWTPIDEIFSIARGAIVTARDRLVIDFDRADLLERIVAFQQTSDVREASIRLGARWSGAWANEGKGARAHQSIQRRSSDDLNADCVLLNYRPFDFRWLFYCDNFLDTPARAVMSGILKGGAIGLAIGKSTRNPSPDHFLASSHSVEAKCAESSKQCHFIPLLIQENNLGFETLRPNLEKDFIAKLSRSTDLGYHNNSDLVPISGNGSNFAPMDVFGYIYSILYSRSYRDRYSSLLRSDFPRMPWSPSNILFRELSRIGVELARLHTLSPDCDALRMPVTRFISKATPIVELGYPKYENGKVMINASCWFEDVTREVWDFHIGGYQVCEKWMKARSAKGGQNPTPGRVLTNDDALHFRRITVALSETIRLMAEIDKVIDEHGGWPDAFAAA